MYSNMITSCSRHRGTELLLDLERTDGASPRRMAHTSDMAQDICYACGDHHAHPTRSAHSPLLLMRLDPCVRARPPRRQPRRAGEQETPTHRNANMAVLACKPEMRPSSIAPQAYQRPSSHLPHPPHPPKQYFCCDSLFKYPSSRSRPPRWRRESSRSRRDDETSQASALAHILLIIMRRRRACA